MIRDWPTVLYFGNEWKADNRTSSHHIARRLMKNARVVYIECPGLRSPKGTTRDISKIFTKVFTALRGPRPLENSGNDNYVSTLFQIPFHRFTLIRELNAFLVVFSLKRLCRKLRISKPILWFVIPHLSVVLGRLNESLSVYYCIDDYASLPGVDKKAIQRMDTEMALKSDVVFVSSEPLVQQKQQQGSQAILSRHGVDFEHFNQVFSRHLDVPEDVRALKKPVIGFFGLIETWVDLDLIHFMAESRPTWNFLMIGRVAVTNNPCAGLPNVHFIGSRSYDELPRYAQVFDVAVIPCRVDDLIINFNPLKLREYLAMGKPVVSVRFPEIEEFTDVVAVAENKEDFLQKTEWILAHDTRAEAQKRIEKVRGYSWDNRFEMVTAEVTSALEKRAHNA